MNESETMNDNVLERILANMVEIAEVDDDHFLMIKETLTRIGVASGQSKTLTQSAHLLHKRGQYYITHFKSLFELDGKASNLDSQDRARLNTIASLLESWGLVTIIDKPSMKEFVPVKSLKIIPSAEKKEWTLVAKHRLGSR